MGLHLGWIQIVRKFDLLRFVTILLRFRYDFATISLRDLDLAEQCENSCIDELAACLTACSSDADCTQQCYRDEIECVDSCPCHADCPQGLGSTYPDATDRDVLVRGSLYKAVLHV